MCNGSCYWREKVFVKLLFDPGLVLLKMSHMLLIHMLTFMIAIYKRCFYVRKKVGNWSLKMIMMNEIAMQWLWCGDDGNDIYDAAIAD